MFWLLYSQQKAEILSLLKANRTRGSKGEKWLERGESYVSGLRYVSWGSKVAGLRYSVEIPDR